MINIILVDDHALFRLGVKGALMSLRDEICIVGEADCGKAFFSLLETTQADMVLLDIVLPDLTGIEIARRLRKEHPEIKILALSAENTHDVVRELLDIGIEGFISKRQGAEDDLPEAIFSIASGLEYFGKDIASLIYDIFVSKKKSTEFAVLFTDREKEIIALCRDGLLSKEIAERLNISPRTVDSHKNNIFKKLDINNTVEMVQYALKHGIINLE
jgi:DNA-binding NarL/FixJ family response regulator